MQIMSLAQPAMIVNGPARFAERLCGNFYKGKIKYEQYGERNVYDGNHEGSEISGA